MMDTWVQLPEKLKSCDDDQEEHTTWIENAEEWIDSMHKEHKDYKYAGQREDECCCC
jgi:hypothetical protein